MVTHLYDSARVLEMHMLLTNEVLAEYQTAKWRAVGLSAAVRHSDPTHAERGTAPCAANN